MHTFRPAPLSVDQSSLRWTALAPLLLSVLAQGASAAPAEATHASDPATALVFATGTMIGAQTRIRTMFKEGSPPMTQSFVDCVGQIKPHALVPFWVARIQGVLTPAEAKAADAYWSSDAGLRQRDAMLVATYEAKGEAPPVASRVTLSDADKAAFEQFKATEPARKLGAAFSGNPALDLAVRQEIKTLFDACQPRSTKP